MSRVKKVPSLSVFFPCFNEEGNVVQLIEQFAAVLPQVAHKYEVIVIDDGSTDGTLKRVKEQKKKYSFLRVVSHSKNKGYGASLRSGFAAAKYEWTFFTDGDLQFDVKQLKEFIDWTPDYNVIIGYRLRRAEGSLRALNARLFKVYIDLLFRLHVTDIDCAFKLIRTDILQSLQLLSTGAFTSSELLYRLKKNGEEFKQLPVQHFNRTFGKPTGNSPKVILKAGIEAFSLYVQMKFHHSI